MLNHQNLDQIKNFLNLERISVTQKITINCFLKDPKLTKDLTFTEKVLNVENQLKKLSPNIELKIIEEGEILNVEQLEFFPESGINGITECGK